MKFYLELYVTNKKQTVFKVVVLKLNCGIFSFFFFFNYEKCFELQASLSKFELELELA